MNVTRAGTNAEPTTPAAPPKPQRGLAGQLIRRPQTMTVLVLLALVAAFGATHSSQFLTAFNMRSVALDAASFLVLAVGMTFVITTGGIDLSVGTVLIFSGVVGVRVMTAVGGTGAGTVLAGVLACVITGVLWGILNGLLVTKAHLPPLIATLATYSAAYCGALVLTKGVDLSDVPDSMQKNFGFARLLGVPTPVWVAIAVTAVGALLLARTAFGLYTRAIGSNIEAARRSGIKVDRHLIKVYALCGGLSGVAGVVSLARYGTTTISGHQSDNLQAIIATVLGGTSLFGGIGSVLGTLVGSLIPAVLNNGLVIIGLQPYWQQVAVGAVLAIVVYVDFLNRKRRR